MGLGVSSEASVCKDLVNDDREREEEVDDDEILLARMCGR